MTIQQIIKKIALSVIICFLALLANCQNSENQAKHSDAATKHSAGDDYTVACYYFPNWGPVGQSEWENLAKAKPRFPGHQQPRIPLWGPQNEQDPKVMAQKIDAAVDNGIDCFIFDWYWYDNGTRLSKGLEEGFLKAANNKRIKFALMWCNHDSSAEITGRYGVVKPETFETITDYVIKNYFSHPSYWKIDGCPYFSVYEFFNLVKTYKDVPNTIKALERFRQKTKEAGFPDLHLNIVAWGVRPADLLESNPQLRVDSLTSYVWVHHFNLPDFPANDYHAMMDIYYNMLQQGGGKYGLDKPMAKSKIPYHPNATVGWDPSPRCLQPGPYVKSGPYPCGPVIINNTPAEFEEALVRTKAFVDQYSPRQKIVTLYAWNEWSEGGYLEPDTVHKMAYLQAIKKVFGGACSTPASHDNPK